MQLLAIKNLINKVGEHYIFAIINSKAICISIGHDINETLSFAKYMIKQLTKDTEYYIDNMYYVKITINDQQLTIFTPIILNIVEYKFIENELKVTDNKCLLWMSIEHILLNKFKFKNIRKIIALFHNTELHQYTMKSLVSFLDKV
jgi:hypothetical protein